MIQAQILEIKNFLNSKTENSDRKPDRQTTKLLIYLFTASKGGLTRLQIIVKLSLKPQNTHQLSKEMCLDYKAIQHHLRVLEKNNMITRTGRKYGSQFHMSNFLEFNIRSLDLVVERLERKLLTKKVYY